MRVPHALLAIALLAGCVQPAALPLPDPHAPILGHAFSYEARGCDGYLLALAVEPDRTDATLPTGFHLRDPSDFFRESPTATGMALVVVAALLCAGGSLGNRTIPAYQEAFAGIYVRSPAVAGERSQAGHDFYETDHFAPPGELGGALAAWGWPVAAANLTAAPNTVLEMPAMFTLRADGPPVQFAFGGATPAPHDDGTSVVRLWRDTPAGLARIDYTLPLQFGFGPGTCSLAASTQVAQVVGTGTCPAPVVAARLGFPFPATAVLEAGRRAL